MKENYIYILFRFILWVISIWLLLLLLFCATYKMSWANDNKLDYNIKYSQGILDRLDIENKEILKTFEYQRTKLLKNFNEAEKNKCIIENYWKRDWCVEEGANIFNVNEFVSVWLGFTIPQ